MKKISKNCEEEEPGLKESAMNGVKTRKHILKRFKSTRNVGASVGGDRE